MRPLTREEVRKFSGAYGKRALLSVPKVLALLDERDELLAAHNAALAEVERLKAALQQAQHPARRRLEAEVADLKAREARRLYPLIGWDDGSALKRRAK